MNLESFIRARRSWQWGGTLVISDHELMPGEDCTTFVASWVQEAVGVDPAAGLRGSYSTAEEANAIVDRAGDIVRLIGSRIEPLGWVRTNEPADGDIGIVAAVSGVDGLLKQVPAIRFGPLWSVMTLRGAMTKQLDWTGVAWRAS